MLGKSFSSRSIPHFSPWVRRRRGGVERPSLVAIATSGSCARVASGSQLDHPEGAGEEGLHLVDAGQGAMLGEVPEIEQCGEESRILGGNVEHGLPP